jgi:DUF4097 and DUF4098 domain-containing protein YvlB
MHSAQHEFSTSEPIRLDIQNDSGDIEIKALPVEQSRIVVTANNSAAEKAVDETVVTLSPDGRLITVRPPHGWKLGQTASLRIQAQVPVGSSVAVDVGSGDIAVRGRVGDVQARTGSGDVSAEEVGGEARVNTGSGDITLADVAGPATAATGSGDVTFGDVAGPATANTGSGDVSVRSAAQLKSRTGSGDITIATASGDVGAHVGSGDISIGCVSAGRVRAETASGDVSVGIAPGVVAKLDVSTVTGHIGSELDVDDVAPDGDVVDVYLRSVTGDVRLHRAGG